MKLDVKPLNDGEKYCCSVKKAKEIFKGTPARLIFENRGAVFTKKLQHPLYRYVNKYVKGLVFFYMIVSTREETPSMFFFSMKKMKFRKS